MSECTVKFGGDLPCISVQTHNDTFNTPTVLGASTLCKKLVYLLFCRVETQVTNLEIQGQHIQLGDRKKGRLHIELSTLQAYHSASDGRRVTESLYNWRVGPRKRLREPLGIQVAGQSDSKLFRAFLFHTVRLLDWEWTRLSRVSSLLPQSHNYG